MGTEHPNYKRRFKEVTEGHQDLPIAERHSVWVPRARSAAIVGFVVAASLGALTLRHAEAAQSDEISGRWVTKNGGSVVGFLPCNTGKREGVLCGHIVWLLQPLDADGHPRRDTENPASEFRNRPLLGLQIISGLRETGPGMWGDGTLYDPDDGHTYSGSVRLMEAGTLQLEGCFLVILCRSETWRRPTDNHGQTGP